MLRPIVQAGDPVLRGKARDLRPEEISTPAISTLIAEMRETMRAAPGVGLAAPQIGLPLRLAVIEDNPPAGTLSAASRAEFEREPVAFHVLINPRLTIVDDEPRAFFEGCLSLTGFRAITPRAKAVHVDALDEHGQPISIDASGWYARILQHEIDHLDGLLYIDRMFTRSFMSVEETLRHWAGVPIAQVRSKLGV